MATQEYVVRTEGKFNSYGLGTEVIPGVTLFKAGDYGLTKEELNRKLIANAPRGAQVRLKQ